MITKDIENAKLVREKYKRCTEILAGANKFAEGRWYKADRVSGGGYFLDQLPLASEDSVNFITTCTAIYHISSRPTPFSGAELAAFDGISIENISSYFQESRDAEIGWTSKNQTTWSPYTASWGLLALATAASNEKPEIVRDCFRKAGMKIFSIVEEQSEKLRSYLDLWATDRNSSHKSTSEWADYDHIFFVYNALNAFRTLRDFRENVSKVFEIQELAKLDNTISEYKKTLSIVEERIYHEFFAQMTYVLTDLPHHQDVVSLALSLVELLKIEKPDDKVPEDVLVAALDTIFGLQHKTGLWDSGAPLLGAATGQVGCSSVEIAYALLIDPRTKPYFARYSENYLRLLEHIDRGHSNDSSLGWPTDIRRKGSPRQTWYGCLVYSYLFHLSEHLKELAGDYLLSDFKRTASKSKVGFDDLLDFCNYKKRIKEAFIEPRRQLLNASSREDVDKWKKRAKSSAILFGPPGTGKTTIAHSMADALEWDYIEIGPGDFLKQGLDGVFSQGDEIFDRLILAENAVVLFDELDEWVLEREEENSEKISRFLTTYMLPWVQRLKERGNIIFLFATNRIDQFDKAIKRRGRFDLIVPVGPPDASEKAKLLVSLLGLEEKASMELAEQIDIRATRGDVISAVEALSDDASHVEISEAINKNLQIDKDTWNRFLSDISEHLGDDYLGSDVFSELKGASE